mgnify:CR=1 FL=1
MADDAADLAAFTSTLELSSVPDEVVTQARLTVADSVGAIVGGADAHTVGAFIEELAAQAPGPIRVCGTAVSMGPHLAALAMGTAGSALELDEGHRFAAGHPAMHVLPAVLAAGQQTDATGEQLLTAFIAGYEVAARVGMAVRPLDPVYHVHGVWGTVGAAAAVARLRGRSAAVTADALRIAAGSAQHTSFDAALQGATVRDTYMGMSAMSGLLAVDAATAGIGGLSDGIRQSLRRTTDSYDPAAVTDAVGDRWEVGRGYFKTHAACRYTHGALDAVLQLQAEAGIAPTAVESVVVETYPTAARLDEPAPTNSLQAKFSLPFAVATALVHGRTDKTAFAAAAIGEETLTLADRVTVREDPTFAEMVPDRRPTRVRVTLRDGPTHEAQVDHPRGGPERPFTTAELAQKFGTLLATVPSADADELWDTLTAGSMPSVDTVVEAVTPR